MSTKILQQHRVILKTIYESAEGLNVYTLAKRTTLNPYELSRVLIELERMNFVAVDSTRVKLTKEGVAFFLQNADIANARKRSWRAVPEEVSVTPIAPFMPYLPQITGVDPSLLPEQYVILLRSLRREERQ